MGNFGGGFGSINLAVTIGCILCIPIVLIADPKQVQQGLLTDWSLTGLFLLLVWDMDIDKIFEMLENKIEDYGGTSKFLSIT